MPTRFPTGISYLLPSAATGTFIFTAGDVTPNVSLGVVFQCHAGSAVTITNFDGGEPGQEIKILSTTAGITTIQDSAGGIITSRMIIAPFGSGSGVVVTTAGDLVLQLNEFVSFVRMNSSWYQFDKAVQL